MTDLDIYLAGLRGQLLEAAPVALTPQTIKRLKPGQWVKVYHATHVSSDRRHGPQNLVFGIDAVSGHSRMYNQDRHGGLYVAPTLKDTRKFGDLVFEIAARTNNLHGTTYGGVIGRHELRGDQKSKDWLKSKYPDSFRPRLSDTLDTSSNEPQALLVGLVRPLHILAVHYKGKRYGRREFIEAHKDLLRGGEKDSDPATTSMSVDDILGAVARKLRSDKKAAADFMRGTMERDGVEGMEDLLGDHGLQMTPLVARAMARKLEKAL